MRLPWRVLITVATLGAVAMVALVVEQITIAALAVGALAGYLGKVNGQTTNTAS